MIQDILFALPRHLSKNFTHKNEPGYQKYLVKKRICETTTIYLQNTAYPSILLVEVIFFIKEM